MSDIGSAAWFLEQAQAERDEAEISDLAGKRQSRIDTILAYAVAYDRAADAIALVESAKGAAALRVGVIDGQGCSGEGWVAFIEEDQAACGVSGGNAARELAARLIATALELVKP